MVGWRAFVGDSRETAQEGCYLLLVCPFPLHTSECLHTYHHEAHNYNPLAFISFTLRITYAKSEVQHSLLFFINCWNRPGSEAEIKGVRPSYWLVYDQSIPYDTRVNKVCTWRSTQERDTWLAKYDGEEAIMVYGVLLSIGVGMAGYGKGQTAFLHYPLLRKRWHTRPYPWAWLCNNCLLLWSQFKLWCWCIIDIPF